MKNTFAVLVACALVATVSTVHATVMAGPITNSANGHIYYLISPNAWTACEAEAQEMGGHLATIRSATENQWIFNTFSSFNGIQRHLWIGLTDGANEGTYVWSSGALESYRNWALGEPNNANASSYYPGRTNENYVFIFGPQNTYAGKWNDSCDDANNIFSFLCGVVELTPGSLLPDRPALTIWPASEITWPSEANRLYQVQWSSQVDTNLWSSLGPSVRGNGGTNSVLDSTRGRGQKFFRVLILY